MKVKISLFLPVFLALFSFNVEAAKPPKLIYEAYYKMTTLPSTPYGWYSDRVEETDGKIAFKNHLTKKENGEIQEEILTTLSMKDDSFQPLFYNFQQLSSLHNLEVDGTIKKQTGFLAKVRINSAIRPDITRSIPRGTIWSSMFSIWLQKNGPQLKQGESKNFRVLLEDSVDLGFEPVSGRVTKEASDEFAKKQSLTRYKVVYGKSNTFWYLDTQGIPIRIDFPDGGRRVEKTTREVAESYLKPSQ